MRKTSTSGSAELRQGYKVLIAVLAVLTMLVIFAGNSAYAYTTTEGDFEIYYKGVYGSDPPAYTDIQVKAYKGHTASVELPATVTIDQKQWPVTSFSESVFKNNTAITAVSVPEGYTDIPASAFSGCTGLETVNVPGSATTVGSYAFENCSALKNLTFDADTAASMTLGTSTFAGCTSLTSVALPARYVPGSGNAFFGCTSLASITVDAQNQKAFAENNVVYSKNEDGTAGIEIYPFGVHTAKLEIPAQAGGLTVSTINPHAFRKNADLTEVTIPASVKTIERFAFQGCPNLKTVNLLGEEAVALNSSCFTGLPSGSVINVLNETVAASFAPPDLYTNYYDANNTTVTVKAAAPATVDAALTLKAVGISETGEATFELYLDSASFVNTMLVKLTFDPAQLTMGNVVLAGDAFDNVSLENRAAGTVDLMFNKLGNVVGYSGDTQVKIAVITMNAADGVTGELPLTISKAAVSGITDVSLPTVDGSPVVLTAPTASVFVADYDANGDGVVNQVDITESQRYYQATSESANWEEASKADINGDGVVDLEDLIAIFHNLTDF